MSHYEGPERRMDYLQLDSALKEVQRLHGSVNILADAMQNSVPRSELEALRAEVKRDFLVKLYFIIGISVASVLILMGFINMKFNHSANDVRHGHNVIACLLGQPEASRTAQFAATAEVTCEQTSK